MRVAVSVLEADAFLVRLARPKVAKKTEAGNHEPPTGRGLGLISIRLLICR
jgi:hypothetical protein